jgi:hypothetical protein
MFCYTFIAALHTLLGDVIYTIMFNVKHTVATHTLGTVRKTNL